MAHLIPLSCNTRSLVVHWADVHFVCVYVACGLAHITMYVFTVALHSSHRNLIYLKINDRPYGIVVQLYYFLSQQRIWVMKLLHTSGAQILARCSLFVYKHFDNFSKWLFLMKVLALYQLIAYFRRSILSILAAS